MKKLSIFLLQILLLAFLCSISFGQNTDDQMPEWLREHMEFMTAGTGRWTTDNSKYMSENEPFDEYGTEWKWGIGKKSIKGRLFGLKDNKEAGDFWEFYLYWHPQKRAAILQQLNSAGVFGSGEMRSVESGDAVERMTEMTFFAPGGTQWKDLHKIRENRDEHNTVSFLLKDGNWSRQREYVWKRTAK
ncbi:MAG: hypothetical protein R2681_04600 [Pyrinomonadaceae bacterium]